MAQPPVSAMSTKPIVETGAGSLQPSDVDYRQNTMEGFRSLAVIATFFAGLQATMLAITLSENPTVADKLVNAFWLAGISMDVYGAILSTIAARWFELLNIEQIGTLNRSWSSKWKVEAVNEPRSHFTLLSFLDNIIASALFSGFPVVACGVGLFLVGLLIYVWSRQPLLVSIISSVPFVILTPLVAACFIPHSTRKDDVIVVLSRKRGAW